MRTTAAITVNRPVEDVYLYWRQFENLPTFMYHLESVEVLDENRSRWQAKAPAGTRVTWEAELVEDNLNALIAWRSLEGADVDNTGAVTFTPAPAGQGTEVTVDVEYRLPGGKLTALVAKLFGEEPAQQIHDDLRRFKQVLETGEVLRSDASPAGTAAGHLVHQEEAQPA